jgi:hypothetical protein
MGSLGDRIGCECGYNRRLDYVGGVFWVGVHKDCAHPPRSNVVGLGGFESDSVDELVEGFSDGAI